MKNNKGFTLLEMLLVVAIIAALGVTAGISADFSMKKAKRNEYKDAFREIFNASNIYSELNSFSCSTLNTTSGCSIELQALIEKGVLDKNILEKRIGIYKNDANFSNNSIIKITKINGVKEISFVCDTSLTFDNNCSKAACIINMNNIKDYEMKYWETC